MIKLFVHYRLFIGQGLSHNILANHQVGKLLIDGSGRIDHTLTCNIDKAVAKTIELKFACLVDSFFINGIKAWN